MVKTSINSNQTIIDPMMNISLLLSIVIFFDGIKIMKMPINSNVTAMFTLRIFEVKKKIMPKHRITIPIILMIDNVFDFTDFSFKNELDSVDTIFFIQRIGIKIISI